MPAAPSDCVKRDVPTDFTSRRDEQLPPQSWLFSLGCNGARLCCGSSVEIASDAFFEGAWAAPFHNMGFDRIENVFGSGGRLTSAGWILVPPSHTLEAVYVFQTGAGGWLASNSLAFLLTAARAEIEFRWPETPVSFVRIVDGIQNLSPLQTSAGLVHIVHHHNVVLGQNPVIQPKPLGPAFSRFEDYRDYLLSVVGAAALNARHPARRTSYSLLATLSSGYDSSACAALARSVGCSEGITVYQSRDGESDDGSEIGKRLGLQMTRVEHPLFTGSVSNKLNGWAEFWATGMQGEDITYAAFEGLLNRRLLITGFHGDKVWDRHAKSNSTLERGDISGSSLGEFRLRQDFVHLPLPFAGALQHPSIRKISNSREMHTWSVGGDYDRPIPRRIAEEAGVPREFFGYRKRAISTLTLSQLPGLVKALIAAEPVSARARYLVRLAWYHVKMTAHRRRYFGERRLPRMVRPLYRKLWSAGASWLVRDSYPVLSYTHPFEQFALAQSLAIVRDRYRRSYERFRNTE